MRAERSGGLVIRRVSILLSVVFIFFLLSCHKESSEGCHQPDKYYKLDSARIRKVPYTGYDTLRFAHYYIQTNGDTIPLNPLILTGKGKVFKEDNFIETDPGGGCPFDVYGENFTINYASNQKDTGMVFTLQRSVGGSDFQVKFLGDFVEDDPVRVTDPNYGGFFQAITLNGKVYYDVGLLSRRGQNFNFNLYYSATKGIIRMERGRHIFQIVS